MRPALAQMCSLALVPRCWALWFWAPLCSAAASMAASVSPGQLNAPSSLRSHMPRRCRRFALGCRTCCSVAGHRLASFRPASPTLCFLCESRLPEFVRRAQDKFPAQEAFALRPPAPRSTSLPYMLSDCHACKTVGTHASQANLRARLRYHNVVSRPKARMLSSLTSSSL